MEQYQFCVGCVAMGHYPVSGQNWTVQTMDSSCDKSSSCSQMVSTRIQRRRLLLPFSALAATFHTPVSLQQHQEPCQVGTFSINVQPDWCTLYSAYRHGNVLRVAWPLLDFLSGFSRQDKTMALCSSVHVWEQVSCVTWLHDGECRPSIHIRETWV